MPILPIQLFSMSSHPSNPLLTSHSHGWSPMHMTASISFLFTSIPIFLHTIHPHAWYPSYPSLIPIILFTYSPPPFLSLNHTIYPFLPKCPLHPFHPTIAWLPVVPLMPSTHFSNLMFSPPHVVHPIIHVSLATPDTI